MAKNILVQTEKLINLEYGESVENDLKRINEIMEIFLKQPEKYPKEQAKLLKATGFDFFHHYLDEINYFTSKQHFVGSDYFKDGNFIQEKELCEMYDNYRTKWREICKIKYALDEIEVSGKDPQTVFEEYKENKISRLDNYVFHDDMGDDAVIIIGRDSEFSSSSTESDVDETKNKPNIIGACND